MMVQYFTVTAIVIVKISVLFTVGAGIKCPGYCTKDLTRCRAKGGKIIGYCTNALACCDPIVAVTGSCGDTKYAQPTTFFKSPDYPKFSKGDLNCEFKVNIQEDIIGLRIEFVKAEMDGMSYLQSDSDGGSCESDMIFLRGFGSWAPPPRCGNLTGYVAIVDKYAETTSELRTLSIVALMSSLKYRWHIKITQILKNLLNSNGTGSSTAMQQTPTASQFDYEDSSIMDEYKPMYRGKRSAEIGTVDHELTIDVTDDTSAPPTPLHITQEDITTITSTLAPTVDSFTPTTTAELPVVVPTLNSLSEDIYEKPEHRFEIPLIVNGQDTEIIEVPWQASLRLKYSYWKLSKVKIKSVEENMANPVAIDEPKSNEIDGNDDDGELNAAENSLNKTEDFSTNNSNDTSSCSEKEGYHFCGGVLISETIVVSAAHCFFGNSKVEGMTNVESIEVVLGDTNLCTDESKQEILPSYRYEIENIAFHFAYDPFLLVNDIAILKLKKKVKLADNVRPVKLAETGGKFYGQEGLVSGWGDTNLTSGSDNVAPSILQSSTHFKIQNKSFCNARDLQQYGAPKEDILKHPKYKYVFESTLCTIGYDDTKKGNTTFEINSGKGDSGGGLIIFDEVAEPILVGIVSYGVLPTEDAELEEKKQRLDQEKSVDETEEDMVAFTKTIDYFTSVPFYRKWIDLAIL